MVNGVVMPGESDLVRVLAEQLAVARLQTEVAMEVSSLLWLAMPDRNEWIAVVVEDVTAEWLALDETTRNRSELFGVNGFVASYLARVERGVDGDEHRRGCGCAAEFMVQGVFAPVWRNHACQATVWRRHVKQLLNNRQPATDPPAGAAGRPDAKTVRRLRHDVAVQRMRTAAAIQVTPYVEEVLDRQRGWIATVVADVVDRFQHRGPNDPHELTGPGGFADNYLGGVSWHRDGTGVGMPRVEFLDDHDRTDEDVYLRRVWQHHVRRLADAR